MNHFSIIFVCLCSCSVIQLFPTLCDHMNCSTRGLPILHCLPEFAQIHIHLVSDAIQPSHPLLSPSPPALNLSQHESFPMSQLFTSNGQIIGASASVFPMNIQDWFPLGLTGLISLLSKLFSVQSGLVFYQLHVCKPQFG